MMPREMRSEPGATPRQCRLGGASCMLSVGIFLGFGALLRATFWPSGAKGPVEPDSLGEIAVTMGFLTGTLGQVVALLLGLAELRQRRSRPAFALAGAVLSAIWLVGFCAMFMMGRR